MSIPKRKLRKQTKRLGKKVGKTSASAIKYMGKLIMSPSKMSTTKKRTPTKVITSKPKSSYVRDKQEKKYIKNVAKKTLRVVKKRLRKIKR